MFGRMGGARSILASLEIDLSALSGADQRVAQISSSIQTNISKIGDTADNMATRVGRSTNNLANYFKELNKSSAEFYNTDSGVISKNLDMIAQKTRAVSVASGLAVGFGAKQALNLLQQNKMLEIFSRNQAQVIQRQQQFRQLADDTGQSYLTILEAANQLLPTLGRTNADLSQALSIVQRLAIIDPYQGTRGAAIAIREALAGETRSLAFRFEIPRAKVRDAIQEAAGDPQKLIDGLDKLLDTMGFTQDAFNNLMKSGVNAFNRLTDTVRNAMGVAFTPLLQNVLIPLANKFSDFLQNLIDFNPELLTIGSSILLVATSFSPLLFITSKLIKAWSLFGNVVKDVGKDLLSVAKNKFVLGGALGVGAGVLGATALANSNFRVNSGVLNSGDLDRIKSGESATGILLERVKQIVVVLGGLIEGFVNVLRKGIYIVGEVIANMADSLLLIGQSIQKAGNDLIVSILEFALSIAQSTPLLSEQAKALQQNVNDQKAFGQSIQDAMDSTTRRIHIREDRTGARADALVPNWQNQGGLTDALVRTLFPGMIKDTGEALAQAVEEDDGVQKFFDFFDKNSETIWEAWNKIRDINKEFTREVEEARQRREIQDKRTSADYETSDFRSGRDFDRQLLDDLNNYYLERQKRENAFHREQLQEQDDFARETGDRRAEYYLKQQRDLADHERKLLDIRNDAKMKTQEAAAQLDAESVFNIRNRAAQQIAEENSQYALKTSRAQEDFENEEKIRERNFNIRMARAQEEETLRNQLEETEFYNRRQLQIRDFAQRAADEQEDRALTRTRLLEDRAFEDKLREEERDRRIQDIKDQLAEETGLVSQVNSMVSGLVRTASGGVTELFKGIVAGVQSAVKEVQARFGVDTRPVQGPQLGPLLSPNNPALNPFNNLSMPIFDQGGMPPLGSTFLAGVRGPEFINLTSPARVVPPERTASMLRNMSGGGNSFGDIYVNIQDIGSYSPEQAAEIVRVGLELTLKDMVGHSSPF